MAFAEKCSLGAVFVLALSIQAFSQTASIGGTVTDTSGGVLRGAKITVTNTATNIEQAVTTNTAGVYAVPGLQVGTYKVTAAMTGFQTQTKTDLRVGAVAQLRVNFELTVAAREDTVQVSLAMDNALLESSSSAGIVLPEEKLHELPLVGSNILDLVKVMGGVTLSDAIPTFPILGPTGPPLRGSA